MRGKEVYAGGSVSVARADHVHPIGAKLKFAENNWNEGGLTNLLPDTNTWVMSNGKPPMYGAVRSLYNIYRVHGRHSPVFLIPICWVKR